MVTRLPRPRAALLFLAALMALLAAPPPAWPHATATGLAVVTVDGADLDYRLTLLLGELPEEAARSLAAAADGDQAAAAAAAAMLRERAAFAADGAACRPGRVRIQGSRVGDGRVMLTLSLTCPHAPGRLRITDDFAALFGPHYRTILSLRTPAATQELVFQEGERERTVDLAQGGERDFAGFLWMGMEHVLTGYDHLLFLAALLIGSSGLGSVLAVVTAFTVAHSVTLSLATLGLAAISPAIVEPAIAASIVWVAAENLLAPPGPRRWLVAFLFGLVHGFGFASALQELDLAGWALVPALVGFNLGVEAGQGTAILLAAPILLWLRRSPRRPLLARTASLGVAAIGTVWLAERLLAGWAS